jgi:endogenous inhibitor of DNA gyrase (YacG/DUF329 family)
MEPFLGLVFFIAVGWLFINLIAVKCPNCKTKMRRMGENIIAEQQKYERRGEGLELVDETVKSVFYRCPKCGHEGTKTERSSRKV